MSHLDKNIIKELSDIKESENSPAMSEIWNNNENFVVTDV